MWTGCRRHELLCAESQDLTGEVWVCDEESNAYTDIECSTDKYIKPRVKKCWGCDRANGRNRNPKLKVLCYEDIDLWILASGTETAAGMG